MYTMSIRMYLSAVSLLAGLVFPLEAREVSPELRRDITELVAADTAGHLQRLRSGLAEAFSPQVFMETLAAGLRSGQPVEDMAQTRCPMAADIANDVFRRFEARDFDVEAALVRIQELTARPAPATESEKTRQWENYMQLYDRMAAAYRPVLRLREADKERQILEANRLREGVVVLPNGVQMLVEPGSDSLPEINRGTRETGVAFYTRTTRKTSYEELPEAIRSMSAHIPSARSWTFWVPASTVADIESAKQQRREDEQKRRSQLMLSLGGAQKEFYDAAPWARKSTKPSTAKQPEDKLPEPMLKIKIWKDHANSPVQTLPDVVQDML